MKGKKLTALVLISVFVLSLTACAGKNEGNVEKGEEVTQAPVTETVTPAADSEDKTAAEVTPEVTEAEPAESELDKLIKEVKDEETLKKLTDEVWNDYVTEAASDPKRVEEVKSRLMTFGEASMKYGMRKFGEADENGYPLYIALHGGGQDDTGAVNDQQWAHMAIYYANSVKQGIYINPRGIRDTWDTHFNPESYPLYDELIENMILFENVDPNRVYLVGFSAGGDGVYAISPRMADRFAAVNMSAGHPNNVDLHNVFNLAMQLQVGANDTAYDRHKKTAEYGLYLDNLQAEYGEGTFEHRTCIHIGYPHNFPDTVNSEQKIVSNISNWLNGVETTTVMEDTNAITYCKQYVRNPIPERVIWDLSTRADERTTDAFYWLRAKDTIKEGLIVVSFSKENNCITVEEAPEGAEFEILINSEMVNMFKKVTVVTKKGTFETEVSPKLEIMKETVRERGDKNYIFCDVITYKDGNIE